MSQSDPLQAVNPAKQNSFLTKQEISIYKIKLHIHHSANLLLQCRNKRGTAYAWKKFYLVFDEYEYGIIINSFNELRNKLIADGRYMDAADKRIIKFAHAPVRK